MSKFSRIWKRLGSIIIDMAVINLFTSILLWFISPLGFLTYSNLLIDIMLILLYLFIQIIIAYGYQYFTIRRYDRSLGKMFLDLNYYNKKGRKVKKEVLYKREFMKYYLFFATLGLYGVYCMIIILFTDKKLYHENKYEAYVQ